MKFVIYCRKSTEDDGRQVQSLSAQVSELTKIAVKNNYDYEVIEESMSAKEPGRPLFNQMIKNFQKGKYDGILCWKIDRLTRNPVDGGTLQYLLQKEIIKCIKTHEQTFYPNDNVVLLNLEQGMANQYIRDLSVNVKRGNKEKLNRGGWPHKAPFGYLNDRLDKTIIVDKKRGHYVTKAFELYVKEKLSLKQVSVALYGEGLRTGTGKIVGKSTIHRILSTRFYTGYTEDKEGYIRKGIHSPLVSVAMFNEAQALLQGKSQPRQIQHFYSARGFLNCGVCGCAITVDTKKGYQYYFCTNGKFKCDQHKNYMKSEYVDLMISDLFKELQIDDELLDMAEEAYKVKNSINDDYLQKTKESIENELTSLLDKELALTDGYTSKLVREEIFKLKIEDIKNRRMELEEQLSNIQKTANRKVTHEQIKKVFLDCNKASSEYLATTDEKKRNMLKKFLTNATVKDKKIINSQYVSLYSVIAKSSKNTDLKSLLGYKDSNLN